jgi:hypothetical protein
MKKRLFFSLFISNIIAMSLLVLFIIPVSAQSQSITKTLLPVQPLPATAISLSNIKIQNLGIPFDLTGVLTSNGEPVANATIVITVDGKYLGQTSSDGNGQFIFNVHQNLDAGSHILAANYFGSQQFASTNVSAALNVSPAVVIVQTVPPIAGVSFQMDGRQFSSNAEGVAKLSISKVGVYPLDVKTDQYTNPIQRITFERWEDENFKPSRAIQIPINGPIQVGFDVYNQVDQVFFDLNGSSVDPKRTTGITIKSAQGDIFNYKEGEHIWVPASRINRRSTGLEITQLLYSVINVTIDGANVVNKAQQRFYAGSDQTWKISLILYSLQVNAKDALFGFPIGKKVSLIYPSGKVDTFTLDKSGTAHLPSLARGIYKIKLGGTNGIETLIPVALSRNQVIDEKVISYIDLGAVFGLVLLAALALIFIGRPWLLFHRQRLMDMKPAQVYEEEEI